jgi:hypothetical protein
VTRSMGVVDASPLYPAEGRAKGRINKMKSTL